MHLPSTNKNTKAAAFLMELLPRFKWDGRSDEQSRSLVIERMADVGNIANSVAELVLTEGHGTTSCDSSHQMRSERKGEGEKTKSRNDTLVTSCLDLLGACMHTRMRACMRSRICLQIRPCVESESSAYLCAFASDHACEHVFVRMRFFCRT